MVVPAMIDTTAWQAREALQYRPGLANDCASRDTSVATAPISLGDGLIRNTFVTSAVISAEGSGLDHDHALAIQPLRQPADSNAPPISPRRRGRWWF